MVKLFLNAKITKHLCLRTCILKSKRSGFFGNVSGALLSVHGIGTIENANFAQGSLNRKTHVATSESGTFKQVGLEGRQYLVSSAISKRRW